MNENNYGVHQTHCCLLHGCKYGDDDCPVVSGKVKQDCICFDCEEEGISSIKELQNLIEDNKQKSSIGICYINTTNLSDLDILEQWINMQLENSDKNGHWIHAHDLINVINDIRKGGK